MLTCITCKQKIDDDGGEEGPRGTPNTKESVKSLTAQVLILHLPLFYSFLFIFNLLVWLFWIPAIKLISQINDLNKSKIII